MKRLLPAVLCGVTLALAASPAQPQGINLSWDECGSSGAPTANWACDTDAGEPLRIVASLVAPAGLSEMVALECQVDITAGAKLPEWWKHGPSACRQDSALTIGFDFGPDPKPCLDFTGGQWLGGMAIDAPSSNRIRVRLYTLAVDLETPVALDSGAEYYAFTLLLARQRTQACAGCVTDACIVLNSMQVLQLPTQTFQPLLIGPPAGGRNHVSWQSPKIDDCPNSTPVRSATWGALKSLYR